MFMGTAANAAWVKPDIPDSSDPVSGQEYYIMNVEAGQFVTGTKVWFNWATTTGIENDGTAFRMDDVDGMWTFTRASAGSGIFISGPADGRGEMHVDNTPITWSLFPTNGIFRITIDPANETYGTAYAGKYWGWKGFASSPANAVIANLTPDTDYCDWIFMTQDQYNTFKSDYQSDYINRMKAIQYAKVLENAIKEVRASYPSVDLSEEEKVVENEEMMYDYYDVERAIQSVKEKKSAAIAAEAEQSATVDTPVDMTSSIVNATFDTVGDFTGWGGSGFGAAGTTSTAAERYMMSFDTYQDIKNLPNGVYCLSVDGMYRDGASGGDPKTDYANEQAGIAGSSFLYGVNLVEDVAKRDTTTSAIYHQFHGIEPGEHLDMDKNSLGGQLNTIDVEGEPTDFYVPNSMKDFTNYNGTTAMVENPYYKGCHVLVPVTDGTIRIGVKNAKATGWTIVDNFGLQYYGNGTDAWSTLFFNYTSNAALAPNTVASQSVKDAYDASLMAQVENYEAYKTAVAEIAKAKKAVEENAAAWTKYNNAIKKAQNLQEDPQYSEVMANSELNDYITYDVLKADNDDKTVAELEAEVTKVEEMYNEVVSATPENTDMTSLLTNPDFSNGSTGWTYSGNGKANTGVGFNPEAKCAEAWNSANFDIHQEIKDAPAGLYEIQMQGFYRYGRGENAWMQYFNQTTGDKIADKDQTNEYIKNTPAMVYLNDATANIANVFDYKQEIGNLYTTTGNLAPYKDPLDQYWYPNGMADAGLAFDQGAYAVKAYGLVAKKGDPLVIGVKGTTTQLNDSWAIFTRFKLTYKAYNAELMAQILADKKTWLEGVAKMTVFDDIKATATEILGKLAEAQQSGDGKAMAAQLEEIYKLETAASESKTAFDNYKKAAENLETAITDYEETADESVLGDASELLGNMQYAYEMIEGQSESGVTTEQAQTSITDAKNYVIKLALPSAAALEAASDETPADVTAYITNPSFETGDLTGWTTASGTADTGAKQNSNATYTINNADGSYVFNTWNGSAVDGGFFLKQTVTNSEYFNVPAGTYKLTCLVASDANNTYDVLVNSNGATVTTNDKGTGEEVVVIFVIAKENDPINISVVGPTWFKADNFKLYYHGTESELLPTGVETIGAPEVVKTDVVKFVKNGKILIKKGNKVYTLTGIEL